MTIAQLKNLILTQELDDKLEEFLLELISGQEKVTAKLLNNISSILSLQAEFNQITSNVMAEEAKIYQELAKDPDKIDQVTVNKITDQLADNQKKLKLHMDEKTKTADITQMD